MVYCKALHISLQLLNKQQKEKILLHKQKEVVLRTIDLGLSKFVTSAGFEPATIRAEI